MKLFINHDICLLNESEAEEKSIVFDHFFVQNCKIIYVTDDVGALSGLITVRKFLDCIHDGKDDYINKNGMVLYEKEGHSLLQETEKSVIQRQITTAIPVLDEQNKILYEISCIFEEDRDETILDMYHDKFQRYARSFYLKKDIEILRRVLSEQKVSVIGDENSFDRMIGCLFLDKKNIRFLSIPVAEAYQFLSNQKELLVDLTVTEHSGRNDIYTVCNHGYGWKHFWDEVFLYLEQGSIRMMDRVLEQRKDIFKSYLEKFSEGILYVQSNSLLVFWLVKCLLQNSRKVEVPNELFRSEMLKCRLILNGEREEFVFVNITDFCLLADRMIQWSELYEQWHEKVKILNFICDIPLNFTDSEKKRFRQACETDKCDGISKNEAVKKNFFDAEQKQAHRSEYLFCGRGTRQRRCFENDVNLFYDCNDRSERIENGVRYTCGQPEHYMATIYMIGACTVFGTFVEDKYTIPSLIQNKINSAGKKYRVVNLGSTVPLDYERLIKKLKLCPQDMIVILHPVITEEIKEQIPVIEIGNSVNRIRERKYPEQDIFLDVSAHYSDYGNEIYAECIWEELKRYLEDGYGLLKNNIYDLFQKDYTDLDVLYDFNQYVSELRNLKLYIPETAENIGSIVMNCNPFTRGHRYLIEEARKMADYVVVFLVEEDKSFFSFNDRLEMVKKGTQDLEHVMVIRSGKFILSDITFSEYFCKDSQNVKKTDISASYDLVIFAKYIVPELNIKYRFIGEEPLDYITNQYNRDMKKVLSSFGVCVVELPRKKLDNGEIISASQARTALQLGQYEHLKKLLPCSTLEYLQLNGRNTTKEMKEYD